MMVRVGINGAAGRMGKRLVALTEHEAGMTVVAALEHDGSPVIGQDAGLLAGIGEIDVNVLPRLEVSPQVIIDFSVPAATRHVLKLCSEQGIALVIGTTGLTPDDHKLIDAAAARIPVLQAPNMSLGVNLLFALAAQVAKTLGDDYDIEIVEAHHRFKKDAPSGTALGIAEAICAATGKSITEDVVHGREGADAERKRGEIGMHALRMGDVVGDHAASFATLGERIELRHIASTRDVFANGALRAAKWLAQPGRPPKRYTMRDVLGLPGGST